MTAPVGLRQGSYEGERMARVTLSRLVAPGDARLTALVSELGGEPVVALVRSGLGDRRWGESLQERLERIDPVAELERAAHNGIRFVMAGDSEWPPQLADLAACALLQERGGVPIGLRVKGEFDLREATSGAIAVVGSRAATSYGEHHARSLGAELAGAGRTVVSGAAFGIEQAAHHGTPSRRRHDHRRVALRGWTRPTRPPIPRCWRRSPNRAWWSPSARPVPRRHGRPSWRGIG